MISLFLFQPTSFISLFPPRPVEEWEWENGLVGIWQPAKVNPPQQLKGKNSLPFTIYPHGKHREKEPMRKVHFYFDHPKVGCQGVKIFKIFKFKFGVPKRVLFCCVDEGIEASKIIVIPFFNQWLLCNTDKWHLSCCQKVHLWRTVVWAVCSW